MEATISKVVHLKFFTNYQKRYDKNVYKIHL